MILASTLENSVQAELLCWHDPLQCTKLKSTWIELGDSLIKIVYGDFKTNKTYQWTSSKTKKGKRPNECLKRTEKTQKYSDDNTQCLDSHCKILSCKEVNYSKRKTQEECKW